jgi:hypothetical protein
VCVLGLPIEEVDGVKMEGEGRPHTSFTAFKPHPRARRAMTE